MKAKLVRGVLVALAVLVGTELLFRAILLVDRDLGARIADHRAFYAPEMDEGAALEPHPYWVYTHSTSLDQVNGYGFTFDDLPRQKPPGTTRIACLGGSTTAGPTSWPYWLEQELTARGQKVEVLNFGTQGWTTAESLMTYALLGQDYQADIVVVHHVHNDLGPQMSGDFRPDYAHFRKPMGMTRDELGRLQVKQDLQFVLDATLVKISSVYVYARLWLVGDRPTVYTVEDLTVHHSQPQPEGAETNAWAFERNLRSIATIADSQGARVVVTTMPYTMPPDPGWAGRMDQQNQRVVRLAQQEGWTLVPLHEGSWPQEWFTDALHVGDEGNQEKARRIADAL